jgi:hypothetical protein
MPAIPTCDNVDESEQGWVQCREWSDPPLYGCEVDGEECIGISSEAFLGVDAFGTVVVASVSPSGAEHAGPTVTRQRCTGFMIGGMGTRHLTQPSSVP